jgi:hypothetical protein
MVESRSAGGSRVRPPSPERVRGQTRDLSGAAGTQGQRENRNALCLCDSVACWSDQCPLIDVLSGRAETIRDHLDGRRAQLEPAITETHATTPAIRGATRRPRCSSRSRAHA